MVKEGTACVEMNPQQGEQTSTNSGSCRQSKREGQELLNCAIHHEAQVFSELRSNWDVEVSVCQVM